MAEYEGLLEGLTDAQIAGVKHACEQSQHYFTRFFFKAMEGHSFRVGRHHRLIDEQIDRVFTGELFRLLFNEPPGYSKTLQCVIMPVARGFAINPRCRFLHASYSRELVNLNSSTVQDIMALPEYRLMWGRSLRLDTSAKGLWRTPEGGSFKASPAGGAVTGFRAGNMDVLPDQDELEEAFDTDAVDEIDDDLGEIGGGDGFSGALLVDDPLKPDDAYSDVKRDFVNGRYMNTFRSRLAHERVPIMVAMQRIHPKDFSNHLLTGGGGEKFHHVLLPIEIDNAKGYPTEYSHGIPVKHGLKDGPLWEEKHNQAQIDALRKDGKVFAAQYLQDPRATNNAIFKPTYFRGYEVRPRTLNVGILVDPSKGKATRSDRTAMAVIGVDANANKFLLDGFCHRMKLSERWENLRRLWQRWNRATGIIQITVGYEEYGLQADLEHIEERQQIEGVMFPIVPVNWVREGSQSKEDRIQRLEPDFKASRFFLPAVIHRVEEGGDCFWEGKPNGVEFRRAWGKTSAQRDVAARGEGFRVAEALMRRDENGALYDLTWMLMQELKDYPNALYKDLSDATSRLYDIDLIPAPKAEVDLVHGLNDSLVA